MFKRFIKNSAAFFIILISLIILLNLCYYKFVLTHTHLERVEKQFYDYKGEIKILFLGDSHTERDLNPLIIDKSFNFASPDENYIETYYKLKTLLDKEIVNPDIIIIPIDLHSFSSIRVKRFHNEWYWKRYIGFEDLPSLYEGISPVEVKIKAFFPVMGNGLDFLKIIVEGKSELIRGYKITYGNFSNFENKSLEASKTVDTHLKDPVIINEVLLLHFQKILDLAEEKNIRVILIKFPITEEYYDASNKYIPNKEEYYKKILDPINGRDNLYVFDYQKVYFDNPSFFHNDDHLNKWGADAFTQFVNENLKSLS